MGSFRRIEPRPAGPAKPATPAAPTSPTNNDPLGILGLAKASVSNPGYNAVAGGTTLASTPAKTTVENGVQNAVANSTGNPAGAPAQGSPADRVKSDLAAGMGFAKDHIADGSLGRLNDSRAGEVNDLLAIQKSQIGASNISDPRQAQMNALLSQQQQNIAAMGDPRSQQADELLNLQRARLNGMTPEEQRAAFEQGQLGINRQLSSSMRQLGGLAAANGVRGGAAAGLQMGAINAASAAQGDLQRKLVLDNLQQKNLAFDQYGNQLNNQQRITLDARGQKLAATDQYGRTLAGQQNTELGIQKANQDQNNLALDRYGNTLTQQQGVGLGIDQYNIGQQNKEKLGQLGAAFQYGGLIDSYRSGDDAKVYADKNIGLSEKALDAITKAMGGPGEAATKTATSSDNAVNTMLTKDLPLNDIDAASMNVAGAGGQTIQFAQKIAGPIREKLSAQNPDMGDAELDQAVAAEVERVLGDAFTKAGKGEQWGRTKDTLLGRAGITTQKAKIICTEAFRQGLITEEQWQVTQRYRRLLTLREYRGYIHWARPVVAKMRANPGFAKRIAPIVRRMIQAERFALGEIPSLTLSERAVAAGVKIANHVGAALRSLTLKLRKGVAHG